APTGHRRPHATFTPHVASLFVCANPAPPPISPPSLHDALPISPSGTDKTVTTPEDTTYTFGVADFGFTDPNDSPPNNFNRVEITSLPGTRTLNLHMTSANAGDFITKAQLDASQLTYTPAPNRNA